MLLIKLLHIHQGMCKILCVTIRIDKYNIFGRMLAPSVDLYIFLIQSCTPKCITYDGEYLTALLSFVHTPLRLYCSELQCSNDDFIVVLHFRVVLLHWVEVGNDQYICNTVVLQWIMNGALLHCMILFRSKGAFIVYCNAAAVPMYRLLIYRRSTHCSKVKINLMLQYRIAVVGAEMAFRALQPQRS